MPAAKKAAAARLPVLPVIGVARFEAAAGLVERIVGEQSDVFLAAQTRFRDRHRAATARPLDAMEAAQVASAISGAMQTPEEFAQAALLMQESGLRATDPPDRIEMLVAAGAATAPAFLDACLLMVALIELPAEEFREHRKAQTLDQAIADACERIRDQDTPMKEMRGRVARAMDAFAATAGRPPGEGMRLLATAVWQALQEATSMSESLATSSSSLTGSAELTAAGPATT